ncbi:hypothetical protein AQPE_3375 [Aquipluma nitroreducens]|uniref:Uncharacterized protein n=1 Tax=Aquipluma nitroreducens TaxID=2010828 RepID=A0A5K7SCK3_9BACT|nr:hypothetical protein [Aquipluma nitroreducens]BBE19199.1 hypothetical protein AQPE_3375 [Aquipluma nitroreducens]
MKKQQKQVAYYELKFHFTKLSVTEKKENGLQLFMIKENKWERELRQLLLLF